MNEQSFEDAVQRIVERNPEYDSEAYFFIRDALDWTVRDLSRDKAENHHVTGAELCDGVRRFTLDQFGPMSLLVLMQWGISKTDDIGNIVYELITEGVFGKQKSDSKTDFHEVFDFSEAFDAPYRPGVPAK